MKVPLKWLRDYVDIVVSPEDLAHRLTMAGLESDGVTYIGADWKNVYVGQIIDLKPHPNADRLQLVTADYGKGQITVVTGATNISVGDKVPVALVGARLIDGHSPERKMITLKPTKLRGIVSEGMVCSGLELGLSDDHAGILILHPEARVGAELQEELGDIVIDLALTPNRSDALALIGVAREVAALTGQKLRLPTVEVPEDGPPISDLARVTIEAPDLCPRYSAMVIQGVKIGPSPRWMQERLSAAGMRPINNIVDITNYVMLEMGQPLHAFDLDTVKDHHIVVRRAKPGEVLETLDGVKRELTSEMVVIADPEKAIGLGGVMGGANTEISENTTNIILESANFDPINNRRTARALALPTEASRRFEKGLPAELTVQALRRAMQLMHDLGGGVVAKGVIDVYPHPVARRQIVLPDNEVDRLLGIDFGRERVTQILESLDFAVEPEDGALRVTVPPHRVDVSLPADLVEEVARIIGYDAIPTRMLPGSLPPQYKNELREWEAAARATLIGCGLNEIISYSLTNKQRQRRLVPADLEAEPVTVRLGASDEATPLPAPLPPIIDPAVLACRIEPLRVLNPLTTEAETLRLSALSSMLETLRANLRHAEQDVDLFEIGRIYLPRDNDLPDERRVISIALSGYRSGRALGERVETDFFDLKGTVEALLDRFGIRGARFVPVAHPTFHPGRAALVVVDGQADGLPAPESIAGIMGELRREVAEAFDIEGQRAYAATLDLGVLIAAGQREAAFTPLSKYPPVIQDIAVIVNQTLPAETVRRVIMETGGSLVREARLFDVYTGQPIPEGQKSLAYSLTYQSNDHTLTDEEVKAVHARIERALEKRLGAKIRGDLK